MWNRPEYAVGTSGAGSFRAGGRDLSGIVGKESRAYSTSASHRRAGLYGSGICGDEHVLIPRQDTEILVEEVMREPFDGAEILDLCTGSGCILLSLLHYSNHCHGVGVDISPEALQVAECNAGRLEISDEQVEFLEGDLYEALEPGRKFDLLVSNPPYIQSGVIPTLMPEVREHEPLLALDGMEDGLFFYRKIIKQAPEWLRAGAGIYFEIGFDQALAVEQLLREAGFTEIRTVQDYAGLDRVVCARL